MSETHHAIKCSPLDPLDAWGWGMSTLSDGFRWGRARREIVHPPKTSRAAKIQKQQKKARKLQRKLQRKRK